jgi:hypothetical protein
LRVVAKIIDVCGGQAGVEFFIGSIALSTVLGVHQRTAHRWLQQLDQMRVIERTWTGRMCWNDETCNPYGNREKVDRASEYVYRGMPTQKVSTSLIRARPPTHE